MKKGLCLAVALGFLLSAGSADATEKVVKRPSSFGCESKEQYESIMRFAADKDERAFSSALYRWLMNGSCTMFSLGEIVFLVDATWTGSVKIRKKGETASFWTTGNTINQ